MKNYEVVFNECEEDEFILEFTNYDEALDAFNSFKSKSGVQTVSLIVDSYLDTRTKEMTSPVYLEEWSA